MAWRLVSRSATADDMVLDFGGAQLDNRRPPKTCNTIGAQQQTSGPSDGVTLNTMCTSASIARGRRYDSFWRGDDTIEIRSASSSGNGQIESTPSYPTTRKPERRLRRHSQARPPGPG